MVLGAEEIITVTAIAIIILLLVFAVDRQYFRDWTAIFLFKAVIDNIVGSIVVNTNLIACPSRILPQYFKTNILFGICVLPVLGILYNQIVREKGIWPTVLYAFLFGAGITMIEYPIERYTKLVKYINWSWPATFCTLSLSFLASRCFIAFYQWGCGYFGRDSLLANSQPEDIRENMSVCCFSLDKELRFTYVNSKTEQEIKLTRDKILGRCILDVYPTETPNEWQLAYERVLREQEEFHGELFDTFSQKWYQVSLYVSHNGGITGYFSDISEKIDHKTACRQFPAEDIPGRREAASSSEAIFI